MSASNKVVHSSAPRSTYPQNNPRGNIAARLAKAQADLTLLASGAEDECLTFVLDHAKVLIGAATRRLTDRSSVESYFDDDVIRAESFIRSASALSAVNGALQPAVVTAGYLVALIEAKQATALSGLVPGNLEFAKHASMFSSCVDAQALIRQVLASAAQNAKAPQAL